MEEKIIRIRKELALTNKEWAEYSMLAKNRNMKLAAYLTMILHLNLRR
jgi:hypothetical protein